MHRLSLILVLILAGCVSPPPPPGPPPDSTPAVPLYPSWDEVPSPSPESTTAASPYGWHLDAPAESQPLVGGATLQTLTVSRGGHSVDLQLVVFDSRAYDLQVLDQPEDWSGGGKISACMRSAGAAAGVNGGFFTPEFTPMGLMISQGRATGAWQSNKLLSGAVVVTSQPRLLWNAEVGTRDDARHLLQAGPRLVDAGRPVASLDRKKHATRTFIANDGGQAWFFGLAEGVSLGELAEILATPGLTATPVQRALNLDGGRSSALYYRSAEGREHTAPGWSTVRNYLAIIPR